VLAVLGVRRRPNCGFHTNMQPKNAEYVNSYLFVEIVNCVLFQYDCLMVQVYEKVVLK